MRYVHAMLSLLLLSALDNVPSVAGSDSIRFGRAERIVFYRRIEKATSSGPDAPLDWVASQSESPILVLDHRGFLDELACDEYSASAVYPWFSEEHQIPVLEGDMLVRISAWGNPEMFGIRTQRERDTDADHTTVLRDTESVWVPVLPAGADIGVGKEWSAHIPPLAYDRAQMLKPLKEHLVLRQRWTDTVDVMGHRCAKISYRTQDKGTGSYDGKVRNTEFQASGYVYFALDVGQPILDVASFEVRYLDPESGEELGRRLARKYMLLVEWEPLPDDKAAPLPDPGYRYAAPDVLGQPPSPGGDSDAEPVPMQVGPGRDSQDRVERERRLGPGVSR